MLPRIYEVFPLICPKYGAAMWITAFSDDGEAIWEIPLLLGESTLSPILARVRSPPLWQAAGEGGIDTLAQPSS